MSEPTAIVFVLSGDVETLAQLISNITPQAAAANVEFLTINEKNIRDYMDVNDPPPQILIEAVTPESLVAHIQGAFSDPAAQPEETFDLMVEIRDLADELSDVLYHQLNSEDGDPD